MAMQKVMVTAGARAPKNKSIVETPAGKKDLQVVVMTWWQQAAVRTARTYLQGLLGFMGAFGTGAANAVGLDLYISDFADLLAKSASLAVAPAVISLLQNAVEILSKLDNPETRA